MMKRWFESEAQANEQAMKNASDLRSEFNGISVDYRHFVSTCPNPGRVIEYTQKQEILPLFGGIGSPSWECFKENHIMESLYSKLVKPLGDCIHELRQRCCISEFSV